MILIFGKTLKASRSRMLIKCEMFADAYTLMCKIYSKMPLFIGLVCLGLSKRIFFKLLAKSFKILFKFKRVACELTCQNLRVVKVSCVSS